MVRIQLKCGSRRSGTRGVNHSDLADTMPIKETCLFLIHPTPYGDYDVIVVGKLDNLKVVKKYFPGSHLIKSNSLACSVLVIDTSDTLIGAKKIIKECKNQVNKENLRKNQ
jgi:hypothetical protein